MQIELAKYDELMMLTVLDKQVNATFWGINDYLSSFMNPSHHIYVLKTQRQSALNKEDTESSSIAHTSSKHLIGAIVVSQLDKDAEILQLWINKIHQNKKYATYFLTEVIKLMNLKYQTKRFFLEVVFNNIPAIKLYTKLKFRQVGIRKNYYLINKDRFDALIMKLEI